MIFPLSVIPAFLRRKSLRFRLFAASGLILLLLPVAWLLFGAPRAEQHLTGVVSVADIERSVLASGVLQPIRKVEVGAQVSGQLKRLHVVLGQNVKQGTLLAEIDAQLARSDLQIAQADLEVLQAERRGTLARLAEARADLQRERALYAGGVSSQRVLQKAQTELRRLEADLSGIDARMAKGRFAIEQQHTRLAYTRIEAPMDGQVLSIDTREGQTLISAQQAPTLLKLGDLSRIEVRAQVSEADIARIRPGMKAFFSLLGTPDARYHGVVRAIQPTPEKVNNAMFFNVLFDVDNPQRLLRSDMTAQVTLIESEVRKVASIPVSALGSEVAPGLYRVQVPGPKGEVVPRQVRIGLIGRSEAQVLQGLRIGERVILDRPEAQTGAEIGDAP